MIKAMIGTLLALGVLYVFVFGWALITATPEERREALCTDYRLEIKHIGGDRFRAFIVNKDCSFGLAHDFGGSRIIVQYRTTGRSQLVAQAVSPWMISLAVTSDSGLQITAPNESDVLEETLLEPPLVPVHMNYLPADDPVAREHFVHYLRDPASPESVDWWCRNKYPSIPASQRETLNQMVGRMAFGEGRLYCTDSASQDGRSGGVDRPEQR